MSGSTSDAEYVVLLDDRGRPCGQADKATVHSSRTPLHLAFSCWLLDGRGRTLLTRRAPTKLTFPGVWSNSFCGHPAPGEDPAVAVARRGHQELGVGVRDLRIVLPRFRYTATMANGITENELCPVYVAATGDDIEANSAEVADYTWVEWSVLVESVDREPELFSPWLRLQLPLLVAELAPPVGESPNAVA